MKKILLGGSPCTHWSAARGTGREKQASGIGWELFLNYKIALDKYKPDFFVYENNESATKEIQEQIAEELGVELLHFNSEKVSAQSRKRIYGTNIPNVQEPADRGITLKDIIEDDVEPIVVTRPRFKETKPRKYNNGKSPTITAAGGGEHIPRLLLKGRKLEDITRDNYKENSREMTVLEVGRLQTMPDGYTDGLSKTQAMNCYGNGWTAEIIIHILSYMNIPLDEEIEVVALYDGIATGRYCLDKLGYENVKYYAYEINKYPIQVALKNYPDIVQCGDAFKVREKDWAAGV